MLVNTVNIDWLNNVWKYLDIINLHIPIVSPIYIIYEKLRCILLYLVKSNCVPKEKSVEIMYSILICTYYFLLIVAPF